MHVFYSVLMYMFRCSFDAGSVHMHYCEIEASALRVLCTRNYY